MKGLFALQKVMSVKCPFCDHTEDMEIDVTLSRSSSKRTRKKNVIAAEVGILNQDDLERRFERHFDKADH